MLNAGDTVARMPRLVHLLITFSVFVALSRGVAQTAPLSLFGVTNVWRYEQTTNLDGVN